MQRKRTLILGPIFVAALGGLTLLAACGDDGGGSSKTTNVAVTLSEFKIEMPATVQAGPTKWTAKNTGTQEHQVTIGRLKDGKTKDDVIAALAQQQGGEAAALAMVDLYGAPQNIAPGGSVTTLVDLPSGNYLALCFIPDPTDGKPHFAKGMVTTFAVTGDAGTKTALPKEPVITLRDFKFEVPANIDWKKPVKVTNAGPANHEIAIYKINDGKTFADVQAFFATQTPSGPPPFTAAGGITGMAPGSSGAMDQPLTAGHYVFMCFFTDPATGAPHFAEGMIQEVVVP